MSADNWATCPRCLARAQKAFRAQVDEVKASYGKVPEEEYRTAFNALRTPAREDYETFREDYEFYGAGDGTVQVSYSGNCTECHLSFNIDEKHQIPGVDE